MIVAAEPAPDTRLPEKVPDTASQPVPGAAETAVEAERHRLGEVAETADQKPVAIGPTDEVAHEDRFCP